MTDAAFLVVAMLAKKQEEAVLGHSFPPASATTQYLS